MELSYDMTKNKIIFKIPFLENNFQKAVKYWYCVLVFNFLPFQFFGGQGWSWQIV
jgi:hypothetical protein